MILSNFNIVLGIEAIPEYTKPEPQAVEIVVLQVQLGPVRLILWNLNAHNERNQNPFDIMLGQKAYSQYCTGSSLPQLGRIPLTK